jgi:hypothetical protein
MGSLDMNKLRSSEPQKHSAKFSPGLKAERRRAPRRKAHVPVFVYGHAGHGVFYEDAFSKVVSDRGALLTLSKPIRIGQKLLLTNTITQIDQPCRVAALGKRTGRSVEVAVEFLQPAPHFWRDPVLPRRVSSPSMTSQGRKIG